MSHGTHLSSVRWPHMIWAIVTLRPSMLYGTGILSRLLSSIAKNCYGEHVIVDHVDTEYHNAPYAQRFRDVLNSSIRWQVGLKPRKGGCGDCELEDRVPVCQDLDSQ